MKKLKWYDYITINIYWLGLTTVSQSNGLILPLLVQKFAGPQQGRMSPLLCETVVSPSQYMLIVMELYHFNVFTDGLLIG